MSDENVVPEVVGTAGEVIGERLEKHIDVIGSSLEWAINN